MPHLCWHNRLISPYNKKDFFREEIVMIVCVWYNFCEKKWHDMHTCNAYMLCENNIDKKMNYSF